jgi:hypothetical protein
MFDCLSELEPSWPLPWTFQAMVLCNPRRAAGALSALAHALALHPMEIGAWTAIVHALRMLGREAEKRAAHQPSA